MAKLLWLLDEDYYNGEQDALRAAITELGMEWRGITKQDYYMGRVAADVPDSQPCIVMCTLPIARELPVRRPNLYPGAVCNLSNFKCSYYQSVLGQRMLNRVPLYCTWKDLSVNLAQLIRTFGVGIFLRPDRGDKPFDGFVYRLGEDETDWFDRNYQIYSQYVRPWDMVLAAPAQPLSTLHEEYRVFVVGGKAVSASLYRRGGVSLLEASDAPIPYAQDCADILTPYMSDLGYTIDLCLSTKGEWAVVEVGSLSCAGLYACPPKPIVAAVAKCIEEAESDVH